MNTEMEDLLQLIGQSIADVIPGPWEYAQVKIIIEPGVINEESNYIPEEGQELKSFDVDYQTIEYFEDLQNIFSNTPQGKWKQAIFEIKKNGYFDISYSY